MLLKVAAYASVITLFTALYFLRKTKLRSNYCNVERFKCESIPHIACSYNERYKDEPTKYQFVRTYEYSEREIKFILDSFNNLKNETAGGSFDEIPRSSVFKKFKWHYELEYLALMSASNIHTEKQIPCLLTHKFDNTGLYYNYFSKNVATLEQAIAAIVQHLLNDLTDNIINDDFDYFYNRFATSKYLGCGAAEFIRIPPVDDPTYDPETFKGEGMYGVHCIFEIRSKQNWITELPEGEPCSACESGEICDKVFNNLCTEK